MVRRFARLAVVAGLVLGCSASPGKTAAPGANNLATAASVDSGAASVIAEYQARIPQLMAEQNVPGLAVAVVDGDHVLWAQGFGYADRDEQTSVGLNTIFSVQSMSKLFTATAVMRAVPGGQSTSTSPSRPIYPVSRSTAPSRQQPERKITLRMLLTTRLASPRGSGREQLRDGPGHFRRARQEHLGHLAALSGWQGIRVLEPGHRSGRVHSREGCGREAARPGDERRGAGAGGHGPQHVRSWPYSRDGGPGHRLWGAGDSVAPGRRTHDRGGRPVCQHLGSGQVPQLPAGRRHDRWSGRARLRADREQRTVPAPNAGSPAGYALGVMRTRWRAERYQDIFYHGGGGFGFLSDLWWVPRCNWASPS